MTNNTDLVFSKIDDRYEYNRINGTYVKALSAELGDLYKSKLCDRTPQCIITPSGMSAISSVLHGLFAIYQSVHLIYSSELFALTPGLFKNLQKVFGDRLSLETVDILKQEDFVNSIDWSNPDQHKKLTSSSVHVLFIESCSNPNSIMFDFSLLHRLKIIYSDLLVIVDNTWLSSAIINPLDFRADIVVTSLTKYYSGGTAIGGAIIFEGFMKKDLIKAVNDHVKYTGLHVSPVNAKIILDELASLSDRIHHTSGLICQILDIIKSNPLITLSHPYTRGEVYLLYPSVFAFSCVTTLPKAYNSMKQSSLEFKTSFGGSSTRFDPHPKKTGDKVLCRVSVGYDGSMTAQKIAEEINRVVKLMVN
jgi:O-succinylhomoserine sulfhydrylase